MFELKKIKNNEDNKEYYHLKDMSGIPNTIILEEYELSDIRNLLDIEILRIIKEEK